MVIQNWRQGGVGEGQTMCIMDNLKVATCMEINLNKGE